MIAIRDFLDNLGKVLYTLIRVVLLSKWFTHLENKPGKKDCLILGNGPSLTGSLNQHKSFVQDKDIFCVNLFAFSDIYEIVKPGHYVIAGPEFWIKEVDQIYIDMRDRLFPDLVKKTSWPMNLYVPGIAAKYSAWKKIIASNKNIRIFYFNATPAEGWRWFRHLLFRTNAGMPRPHNVLIPTIFLSLNLGYKKIYLFGAEHSWLSEISVDNDNNVRINNKHFYDAGSSKPDTMYRRGKGKRRLHEVLHKYMLSFEGYFVLLEYAESLKAKIFNATPGSFIDAFDRVDPEE
jgi:hypothetical protein